MEPYSQSPVIQGSVGYHGNTWPSEKPMTILDGKKTPSLTHTKHKCFVVAVPAREVPTPPHPLVKLHHTWATMARNHQSHDATKEHIIYLGAHATCCISTNMDLFTWYWRGRRYTLHCSRCFKLSMITLQWSKSLKIHKEKMYKFFHTWCIYHTYVRSNVTRTLNQ